MYDSTTLDLAIKITEDEYKASLNSIKKAQIKLSELYVLKNKLSKYEKWERKIKKSKL